MNVSRIEALADAISYYHQSHQVHGHAYQLRNPGLLRAVSLKYPRDESGYRIFNSVLDGYQALLFDLKLKCSGKSKTRFLTNTLFELITLGYGETPGAAKLIASQIRSALNTEEVSIQTPLSYFLED